MPRPKTPWALKMEEILADGEWHHRDEVVAAIMTVIPPGIAYRVGELGRNSPRQRPNGAGPRVRGDESDSIRAGAKEKASGVINNTVRLGRAERTGQWIRQSVKSSNGVS